MAKPKKSKQRNVLAESDDYEGATALGSQQQTNNYNKPMRGPRQANQSKPAAKDRPLKNAGKLAALNQQGNKKKDYRSQFEGREATEDDLLTLEQKADQYAQRQGSMRASDPWEANMLEQKGDPIGQLHRLASIPRNVEMMFTPGEQYDMNEASTMAGSALGAATGLGGLRAGGVNYSGIGASAARQPLQLGAGPMMGQRLGGSPLQSPMRPQQLQLPAHAGTELMSSFPDTVPQAPAFRPAIAEGSMPDFTTGPTQASPAPQTLMDPGTQFSQIPTMQPRSMTGAMPRTAMDETRVPGNFRPSAPNSMSYFQTPDEMSSMAQRQQQQFAPSMPPEPDMLTEALSYNNRSDMSRLQEIIGKGAPAAVAGAGLGVGTGIGMDIGSQAEMLGPPGPPPMDAQGLPMSWDPMLRQWAPAPPPDAYSETANPSQLF